MVSTTELDPSRALSLLVDDYWAFYLAEHPVTAMDCGHGFDSPVFFKESLDDYERRHERYLGFRRDLSNLDKHALSPRDLNTYELLYRELDEEIQHHELKAHLKPLWFPFGPDMNVAFAVQTTRLFDQATIEGYINRLQSIPSYFDHCIERLKAGFSDGFRVPEVLIGPVSANIRAHIEHPGSEQACWNIPLQRAVALEPEFIEMTRDRVELVVNGLVLPAWQKFAAQIEELFSAFSRPTISCAEDPGGEAYYDFLVRHHTTLELQAEQIHQTGILAVENLLSEMRDLLDAENYKGGIEGIRKEMRTDPRFIASSAEELLTQIQILSKKIDRRIPEFFGVIPRTTYGVESIPVELSSQMPPAYAQPNPADRSQSGIHWVSSIPERCPSFQHIPLALHEAWPGHLMHIALLKENRHQPEFVRQGSMKYTSLIEGWALYCERLGVEFGLYEDIYQKMGRLEMEMWRAIRLVVDTGIHVLSWDRERAVRYMQEHSALTLDVIASEVDRYIGMPGQALAYKLGEMKLLELRELAEKASSPAFDIRKFHDFILSAGTTTLSLLEKQVRAWVEEGGAISC